MWYLHYKNQYYKPDKEVAMGSPISSISAEIFLQYYEDLTIKHWMETEIILYYTNYMDDIFRIFDSRKIMETQIPNQMNKTHKNLQFKISHEEDNMLNFLDL
jgi:hypothetical protein